MAMFFILLVGLYYRSLWTSPRVLSWKKLNKRDRAARASNTVRELASTRYFSSARSAEADACVSLSQTHVHTMDVLPSGNLFRELQDVTDTGYFEWKLSLEDYWQQVSTAWLLSERAWSYKI